MTGSHAAPRSPRTAGRRTWSTTLVALLVVLAADLAALVSLVHSAEAATASLATGCAWRGWGFHPVVGTRVTPFRSLCSSPVGGSPVSTSPLAGRPFYVVPDNPAQRAIAADPGDAAELTKIADRPTAMWLTETTDLSLLPGRIADAAAKGQLPTFVLYAIPGRDCGSYSGGGFATATAYDAFVDTVRADLAGRPSIVILEPDALAQLKVCGLSSAQQTARVGLIRYAAQRLGSATVHVYLDGGGRYSNPAATIAPVLMSAGLSAAAGFALDISAFDDTADEVLYGHALSALTGGAHFVIDTSRNGVGTPPGTPVGAFCNVPGLALGTPPTADTGIAGLDALLWVKYPGESDGNCTPGAPYSGVFWLSYALGLAERAAA